MVQAWCRLELNCWLSTYSGCPLRATERAVPVLRFSYVRNARYWKFIWAKLL